MIRKWILAGLMVWVPLGATLFVLSLIYNALDSSFLLPRSWRFPGSGVLLTAAVLLGTGVVAANYRGGQFLAWAERLLNHIPLVRSLYGGTKKLAETLFSENSSAFRKVVLIEWPRKGLWSVGFQAGEPLQEAREKTGVDMVTVFIPTTPNPTSGFIMQASRDEVVVLDMSVEEGMRYIISLGVVTPGQPAPANAPTLPPASSTL
ncbi:DUF502 domain-containing protein [Nevskia soli]|uniref:DUF502 domain-containing protein n=1 Tax=Nevskia soli TaxID=418856 RepID=UPI0004A77221|nr:DUF502 domain-containing protein [Nevskia soli]